MDRREISVYEKRGLNISQLQNRNSPMNFHEVLQFNLLLSFQQSAEIRLAGELVVAFGSDFVQGIL